jgi:hypothetical protein
MSGIFEIASTIDEFLINDLKSTSDESFYPSKKMDDKILRKYVRKYIDDIFVEFDLQYI